MNGESTKNTTVSSVAKAIRILDCFSPKQPELSLARLSSMLNMPKSTLLNQLRTLEDAALLVKSADGQSYCLGYKLMELGYTTYCSNPVIRSAIPVMEELMLKTGKFVYLTSHLNGKVFYMDYVSPSHRNISYSVSGKTIPMHCTSCGKAMLSHMPEETVNRIIAMHGLEKITKNTITDYDQFMQELEITRKRGYAVDNEEESLGVKCFAMAILSDDGAVAGALSVSGAAISMKNDPDEEQLNALASACNILSPQAKLFPGIRISSIV
ncbi:MAG: IclR family transcriptional regulator [Eubacteriales bacterium]|nr:IclR family transcriptional regulator [Eubacteriales bacterium]